MKYLSSKLMLVFAALIVGVSVGFAQSACPSNGNFHNCFGTFIWHYGDKYVGDWKDGIDQTDHHPKKGYQCRSCTTGEVLL